ncbi:hypothetical protein PL9631_500064 [Planktothrix paucivesiculata PCC 9631]|uniref:Uncharacterized protein n=2 Tax=Planktothrix TaxID=54304 RepID=A0A7Z9BQL5_9CYAN|nr:deaminase domain-containing protein [Planktothrix paucivesiculata]VXD20194.1 hypothetical protein PL9631_500064 [Planktothrix paucivesiculata PCC 9631]
MVHPWVRELHQESVRFRSLYLRQFEPTIDSRTQLIMDTDAEYKVLSMIAAPLEMFFELTISGNLYLYTELQPCESCNSIINQFKDKFPNITVELFWELPYPP